MTTMFELAARLQSAGSPETALWMIAKITLILAIGRLLLFAMPRASAATKHVIATAALIGAAMLPVMSAITPSIDLNVARPAVRAEAQPEPKRPSIIGVSDDETIATAISVAKATGIVDKPISMLERGMNVVRSTWKGMILILFATASLLMLGHMLLGMFGVWLVARDGEEFDRVRGVRLLKSSRVAVPVVWGIFRPVLLLPADVEEWPKERFDVVLQHELAHVGRWDNISLILTRIAVSLFWFHPLAWSLDRAGRSECERACDDLVLASGTKPSDYADHLLAIAREMPAFDPFRSVTLAMSRKTQLEGRLLSILQKDVVRRVFTGRGVAIACALAVAVMVPIAAISLVAKPSDEKDKKPVVKEDKLKSDSEIEVFSDAIGDFVVTRLGGEPSTARGWYQRAYELYHDEHYAESAVAFRRAANDGFKPATSHYNAACAFALANDAAHAVPELSLALDAGWDDYDKIAEDSDFDAIRDDVGFRKLLEARMGDAVGRRTTEAVEKYNDLRARGTTDGDDWFDTGLDLLRLRRFDESIHAFEQAIAHDEKSASAMYNIACAHALRNDPANGMAWLKKAVEQGYSGDDKLLKDPDIALLRKQPGFEELRKLAKELELRGCCDGPASIFFDNWKESARHHAAVVKDHPTSGRAWFNLGFTSLQAGDQATAIDAFRRAIELGYRPGTSSYNIACSYALQQNKDAAFEWLQRARTAGFDVADHAEDDEDLDALHRDPRWRDVVTRP